MPSLAPKRRSLLVRTAGPVVGGIAAIAVIGGLLWLVAVYATGRQRDDSGFEARIGDDAFEVPYDVLLERIEREHEPVLFQDLLAGGHLHIFINHIGESPQEGWVAFEAKREGADSSCALDWKAAEDHFLDPCTQQTFPPDGAGLRQFPTEIAEDGDLVVRLRPGREEETPSEPTSTVPSVGG